MAAIILREGCGCGASFWTESDYVESAKADLQSWRDWHKEQCPVLVHQQVANAPAVANIFPFGGRGS